MGDLTKNFSRHEFACKCGCGFADIKPEVAEMCQIIRDAAGVPVSINSGCRCQAHNKKVGGVPNSFHTSGHAADLHSQLGGAKMYQLIHGLYNMGMLPNLEYCKYYPAKNFVHIDCGKKRYNRFAIGN